MWAQLIQAAIPIISGMIGGRQSKKAAAKASKGARLQDILPLLMPMIQQQQQHQQQNYQQQQDQYVGALPLQSAIRDMAMNLMPNQGSKPPRQF